MADFDDLLSAVRSDGDEAPLERSLLLWFVRHVMQVTDSDEYELVFEAPTRPIDGLLVETSSEEEQATLHIFEVKAKVTGSIELTDGDVDLFMQRLKFLDANGLEDTSDRVLRAAALHAGLQNKLPWSQHFRMSPALVVAGELTPKGLERAREAGIRVFDLPWLARLARALRGPGLLSVVEHVSCPRNRRFESRTGVGAIVVCEVHATELAEWPGIDDRTLFGLNVRGELRQNRVRTGLDTAIRTTPDHPNFIAFHNGLTVLCHHLDYTPDEVIVTGLSVVNGAQSLLAFRRNRERLIHSDLRVLVKFVEYRDEDAAFATEVARRSNTQTAVNPRNLRANDPKQLALIEEFRQHFPEYAYIVKPEATRQPPGDAITNDDAAQWICALYQERPWVAVKRTELFRDEQYHRIFAPDLEAAHIVLARRIYDAIQDGKPKFPEPYRGAWRLTTLMAIYLVGQALRADRGLAMWLREPGAALTPNLDTELSALVRRVADAMSSYHRERVAQFGHDDFKVDFKRENTALDLASRVAEHQRGLPS
jgi:hypothetical protein